MNDQKILGLNIPRVLALLTVAIVLLAAAPFLILPFVILPVYLWLRFDQSSRAIALVERIFDLRKSN